MPYATGSKAVAMLAAGTATQVLHGGTTPSWSSVALDDMAALKRVRVYNAGNLSIPNNSLTAMTWDSESYDTDNWHSTAAQTDRITVNRAGTLLLYGAILWQTGTTGSRWVDVLVNGSGLFEYQASHGEQRSQPIALAIPVASGDYVSLQVFQVSGGALNVIGTSVYSFLQAVMLPA